jgi:transcriptional regulator with XRE-family HTH domain
VSVTVTNPGTAIGALRRSAGISQAELAKRMGTTQSAVARLEGGRLSPSFRTMQKAFAALGRQLEVVASPTTSYGISEARRPAMVAEAEPIPYGQAALDGVDVSQIRDARRRSPDERLRYLASGARGMRAFLDSVER